MFSVLPVPINHMRIINCDNNTYKFLDCIPNYNIMHAYNIIIHVAVTGRKRTLFQKSIIEKKNAFELECYFCVFSNFQI